MAPSSKALSKSSAFRNTFLLGAGSLTEIIFMVASPNVVTPDQLQPEILPINKAIFTVLHEGLLRYWKVLVVDWSETVFSISHRQHKNSIFRQERQ